MTNNFNEFKKTRMKQITDKYNLDVLIASLPENIFYISGFQSISHQILNRVSAFALYNSKNDQISAALPCADVATFIEQNENLDIVCFGDFYFAFQDDKSHSAQLIKQITDNRFESADQGLIEAVKRTGVTKGRIGVDESRVTPQIWMKLIKAYPQIEFVPAESIFGEIRMIKHQNEISFLERATEIAEQALNNALGKLEMGMTEDELGKSYIQEVVELGGLPHFNVVTEGLRTAYADTINTDNQIDEGSLLRFDFGCIYNGYHSDMARTAVVGKPPTKVEEYYEHILRGEDDLMALIKPGITASEIFDYTMDSVRKGIPHYERQHVGHGIGLEIYDPPILAAEMDVPLEESMVFCVETPYYELDWGGVQVEDTLVVTRNGYRLFNKTSRDLIRIGG